MNLVVLRGNLANNVELKYLQSGTAVATLTVVVNKKFKKADGTATEETAFVDCEAWGRQAEVLNEYCKKGSSLLLRGELKQQSWEVEGKKRYKTLVRINEFELIGSKPQQSKESQPTPEPAQDAPPTDLTGDEVPF